MGTVYLSSALVVALALSLCGLEALWEAVGGNRMVYDYLKSLLMALGLNIGLPQLIVKRGEKGMSKAQNRDTIKKSVHCGVLIGVITTAVATVSL